MTKPSFLRRHSLFSTGAAIELGADRIVIRLPDLRVLRLVARYLLLVTAIVSLPWFLYVSSSTSVADNSGKAEYMSTLMEDLKTKGLLQSGNRALFLRSQDPEIPQDSANFVFAAKDVSFDYVDRVLKSGGVVAMELSSKTSEFFKPPENYRLAYVRRIGSTTVIALKKSTTTAGVAGGRKLLSVPEDKKEVLNGLEDPLLEPPMKSRKKPWNRTKYLPELLGDKLEKFPRRVFVDVIPSGGKAGGAAAWFQSNYPMKKSAFDIIQLVVQEPEQSSTTTATFSSPSLQSSTTSSTEEVGLGEWLERNVKEEEYVVVKAEAEAVEEVVQSGAVRLVDELFLECKHQWGKGTEKSRRAYWQCLALYGKLRDEGVAVHQWWGA